MALTPEWVTVSEESASESEARNWHLQWLGDPVGGATLCMIANPEPVGNHKTYTRGMEKYFCPQCAEIYQRVLLMRIRQGEPIDDMRM
jgi:hypothetical protein